MKKITPLYCVIFSKRVPYKKDIFFLKILYKRVDIIDFVGLFHKFSHLDTTNITKGLEGRCFLEKCSSLTPYITQL
jgi:hypothetical protein